jgi:hypothetical protein
MQTNNNNENNGEAKIKNINNKNLDKKRPHSIYLNRNKLSFMSGSNNSNSKMIANNNENAINQKQKIFYNFFSNKLKTQNETSNNTKNNTNLYTKDLNSINKFREHSCQNLEKDESIINRHKNLLNEFRKIKEIWNIICVTPEYQNSFEEMINNLDNEEDIHNILNNEQKQIVQFKNDFLKLMNVIAKREATIENIKKLDKIFLQNRNLAKFNKLFNEKSKSEYNIKVDNNYDELEEKNNEQIENDINNCLKLLRINSVNAFHQFNKFRTMNNFLMTSNKVDVNKLKNNYGFNKNFLIKMKNDLDFLAESNINLLYDLKKNDPFLINLIPEKSGSKYKKLPASEELIRTINNSIYILAQEELLYKMNIKKDIKRNKSNGFDVKEKNAKSKDIITTKNNKFNKNKNMNFLKIKTQKDYKLIFYHNTTNNINNDNKQKKNNHLYIKNKSKEKEKDRNNEILSGIPATTAEELQKKFEYYNKLKEDLTERSRKNEKIEKIEKNDSKEKNNDNLEQNNLNKKEDKEEENIEYKCIWFNDAFNNFKNIYNEYYNKLSKKIIELFSLNNNPDNFICGISPKIAICKNNNNEIYGICAVNYYLDNNKLILKINHLSSLKKEKEKDEDKSDNSTDLKNNMEFKIYKQLLEKIKTLSYETIELNLFINEQNKYLFDYFINNYKFEIKEEEKNKNENSDNDMEEKNKKKTLRLYNNDVNDENILKIKESNEIKYNNTSVISIINEDEYNKDNDNDLEKEKDNDKDVSKLNINKYFYKFINTFNLNILLNYLTKDNIYTLTNTSNEIIPSFSEDIHYASLFIKDKNSNVDNIINIIPDCSLLENNGKIKYAYITSIFNTKVYPYISTIYNKKIYNIYKINLSKKNKEKKIYTINTSDEKINFYIYQIEEESELKTEIHKNNNENFNIFEYFNQLINDNKKDENKDDKNDDCIINFNFEESKEEKKCLWVPSFSIDTQLICDKIPILKDIIIKNNDEIKF